MQFYNTEHPFTDALASWRKHNNRNGGNLINYTCASSDPRWKVLLPGGIVTQTHILVLFTILQVHKESYKCEETLSHVGCHTCLTIRTSSRWRWGITDKRLTAEWGNVTLRHWIITWRSEVGYISLTVFLKLFFFKLSYFFSSGKFGTVCCR